MKKHRIQGIIFLSLIIILLISGLLAPFLTRYDPYQINQSIAFSPPSLHYLFGTDYLGRDLLSRLIFGIRFTVFPAIILLVITSIVSISIGILSTYLGKIIDQSILFITNLLNALPHFITVIVLVSLFGNQFITVFLAILVSWWAKYVRYVRSLVIMYKEEPFIELAKLSGSFKLRTLFHHILPNVLPQMITLMTLDVGKVILTISSLSFLGLGSAPPTPEWGVMLLDSKNYLQLYPWLFIAPGIAIFLTAILFQLSGEWLKKEWSKTE